MVTSDDAVLLVTRCCAVGYCAVVPGIDSVLGVGVCCALSDGAIVPGVYAGKGIARRGIARSRAIIAYRNPMAGI